MWIWRITGHDDNYNGVMRVEVVSLNSNDGTNFRAFSVISG